MARPFLTARWTNLCLISYQVPRALLEPHMPRGLVLDTLPGTPPDMGLASLVAFDFLDTRVGGVKWPGHVNFPEINLRFYVRMPAAGPTDEQQRGVCFIRELVPRPLISLVARRIYNEPYAAAWMRSRISYPSADAIEVEHRVRPWRAGESLIRVRAERPAAVPPMDSMEHWFKEHQWGFGRSRAGDCLTYEVRHPRWAVHRVRDLQLDFDWAAVYGPAWGWLRKAEPISVVLAEGSSVEVHPKRILNG